MSHTEIYCKMIGVMKLQYAQDQSSDHQELYIIYQNQVTLSNDLCLHGFEVHLDDCSLLVEASVLIRARSSELAMREERMILGACVPDQSVCFRPETTLQCVGSTHDSLCVQL